MTHPDRNQPEVKDTKTRSNARTIGRAPFRYMRSQSILLSSNRQDSLPASFSQDR